MPRIRSLLLRVQVRPAGRLCYCKRNKAHEITKGELRFVVTDPGPAGGEKGYCVECGHAMLDVCEDELRELRRALET